jgi:tRNA dimethylallyltransferase
MTLIVIAGATATGKSDLAVNLAQQLGGQIVNADSMQLYNGMDIGTAKLSVEERGGIPHHLLDLVDVSTDVTVAWYQEVARAKIDELLAQSIPTIIVGGTGFYIKAILDDLNFPETNPEVRERLTQEAEVIGGDAMHKRLAEFDPAAAVAIPRENIRRVVRALEVIEITGKPFTANLPREDSTRYPQAQQFGLALDRSKLDERIDRRVEQMWERGFVREVAELVKAGLLEGKTARAALGYSQIIAMAQGNLTESQAKDLTKLGTRQYARRQETWFTRDARITWLSSELDHSARLESILRDIERSSQVGRIVKGE